jgi:hypothetical protein
LQLLGANIASKAETLTEHIVSMVYRETDRLIVYLQSAAIDLTLPKPRDDASDYVMKLTHYDLFFAA